MSHRGRGILPRQPQQMNPYYTILLFIMLTIYGLLLQCQCRTHKRCGFYPWAGKIPWRRKWQPTAIFLPGKSHGQRSLAGLQSMGLQRTGHELVTKQQQQHQRHVNSCSAPFEPGYWSFGALPQAHIIRASRCSRNAPCICHQLLPFTHL